MMSRLSCRWLDIDLLLEWFIGLLEGRFLEIEVRLEKELFVGGEVIGRDELLVGNVVVIGELIVGGQAGKEELVGGQLGKGTCLRPGCW